MPLLLVGGGAGFGYSEWAASRAEVSVVSTGGAPVVAAHLEFFAFDESVAAASPSARLGQARVTEGAGLVGRELVPGEALVRVRADGFGVGYVLARSGAAVTCALGPPVELSGLVMGPDQRGVFGAKVLALGGGAHGVVLAEAETNRAGTYRLAGLSSSLPSIHARVLAPGFAVAEQLQWFDQEQEPIELVATQPVTGRVLGLRETKPDWLSVQAMSVPGVQAQLGPDGSFTLLHLPPAPTTVRLLVAGLPEGWTHRQVTARAGDDEVEIQVERAASVEGVVVDLATGTGIAGASVRHEHGPNGVQVATCDGSGVFRIGRLPSGLVEVQAIVRRSKAKGRGRARPTWHGGAARLDLAEGEELSGVAIEMTP
ncbi:MAG: carboxypeptidase-like regulatory domain-containing protein [Planctomycetota bacterium]